MKTYCGGLQGQRRDQRPALIVCQSPAARQQAGGQEKRAEPQSHDVQLWRILEVTDLDISRMRSDMFANRSKGSIMGMT
ncbi:hypothetical protein EYF80_067935 [Liparis tanakae]|uniref:Uncharacterized protein n=1 Tax=Liparis tanakae TaxID=230148 RepID=A0A4Z2DZI7_9TELE|nr:hypothetical protein EYF80_067935 [Liparis tanakae]